MHRKILDIITKTAKQFGTSRREIIVMLLMQIMRDHESLIGGFYPVKYQPNDDRENWHCFHIRLKEDEYEFFIDLRKLCKCSVSFLVAIAALKYANSLLKIRKGSVDNYSHFKHYVIYREVLEGVYCWRLYWGFPTNHLKTLRI